MPTNEYREAGFMNGAMLSQRPDVDAATVSRAAQRLDYAGYPELLREIRALVEEKLRAAYG